MSVRLVVHDGWADVRLSRPDKRNALSWPVVDELEAGLRHAVDVGCTVAVLGAEGDVFCAGGDRDEARGDNAVPVLRSIAGLRTTPLFVVADVRGDVYGGGLALLGACPVVVCADHVRFVMPAAKSTDRYPERFFPFLGPGPTPRALLDLGVSSAPCGAPRAAALGWVTAAVPGAEMDAEIEARVGALLARPSATSAARDHWRRLYNQHLEATHDDGD